LNFRIPVRLYYHTQTATLELHPQFSASFEMNPICVVLHGARMDHFDLVIQKYEIGS